MENEQWGKVSTTIETGIHVTLPIDFYQGHFLLASLEPAIDGSVNGNPASVYSAFDNIGGIYIRTDVYDNAYIGKSAAVYWLAGGK